MTAMGDSLLGTPRRQLALLLQQQGQPAYRGEQVFRWLHGRRAGTFADMTDLPVDLRRTLAARHDLARPRPAGRRESADGSCKWILELADGRRIESVFIPDGERVTFCLSSQVGCAFGCTFCATATMGLVRNLTAAEIVGQALVLADAHPMAPGRPFNVVFMGMGEPMDNLDAVLASFEILTDPAGFGLSWRRVTISTVGHVPGIQRLAGLQHRPRVAVSLNATEDRARARLMPVNRKWPLAALREALARFPVRPGERVTFEYVVLSGENDSPADARRLAALTQGLPVRVNLIPWNPHPGLPHARPEASRVERMRDALLQAGVDVSIRYSKGCDVAAACGQLVTTAPELERRPPA